jgi:hypothetical protein
MTRRDKLTDADYEHLADLAEAGFDPAQLRPRRGRPSLAGSSGRSPRVAARVTPEVHAQALARAQAEGRTLSEVIRGLVEDYAHKSAPGKKGAPRVGPR